MQREVSLELSCMSEVLLSKWFCDVGGAALAKVCVVRALGFCSLLNASRFSSSSIFTDRIMTVIVFLAYPTQVSHWFCNYDLWQKLAPKLATGWKFDNHLTWNCWSRHSVDLVSQLGSILMSFHLKPGIRLGKIKLCWPAKLTTNWTTSRMSSSFNAVFLLPPQTASFLVQVHDAHTTVSSYVASLY